MLLLLLLQKEEGEEEARRLMTMTMLAEAVARESWIMTTAAVPVTPQRLRWTAAAWGPAAVVAAPPRCCQLWEAAA
jgi:hypothetical protein